MQGSRLIFICLSGVFRNSSKEGAVEDTGSPAHEDKPALKNGESATRIVQLTLAGDNHHASLSC